MCQVGFDRADLCVSIFSQLVLFRELLVAIVLFLCVWIEQVCGVLNLTLCSVGDC